MTLMRMLAFMPTEPGSSVAARSPSQVRPTAGPVAKAGQDTAIYPAADSAEKPRDILKELSDWRALVGKIKVGGMARMLADNCEFCTLEDGNLELAVPDAHKHLLDKTYTDKLQSALQDYFGTRLRLHISTGGGDRTPAAIESQERRQKQEKAIEAIDTDPFVRDLVENFDARVNGSSVKPVQ